MRIFHLAPELAVRERARAAFAKLHVALWVQHLLAPKAPCVLGALAHGFAALQHQRIESQLRQSQRSKQTARACANHNGALKTNACSQCFGVFC